MKTRYLVIDIEACIGCNNCLLACKDEHVDNRWPGYSDPQPNHGHYWIDVVGTERGQFPLIDVAHRPMLCMHCEDGACVKASTAVHRRDDGIVVIVPDEARGQKGLIDVCPYHMIWWNEVLNVPQKCTFCAHLIDDGWKKPRCVQACPTGALRAEYVEEAEMRRIIDSENLESLSPEHNTHPHVYYKNMYRYTQCFIAGSVAVRKGGLVDCASGARVALLRGQEKLAEAITDAFGDFKFDRLDKGSGEYVLEVYAEVHEKKHVEVGELTTSVNVGTICF